MARIKLNLASRPFRNDRLYYFVFGLVCALIYFFTAYNFWGYIDNHLLARSLQAKVDSFAKQEKEVRRLLDDPERHFTRGQEKKARNTCDFINNILARRSFSWTLLFNELERVTPAGVRVSQISPAFRGDEVGLVLSCVGQDLEKDVLGFINNLNASASFSNAYLGGETRQTEGFIQFPVGVNYHPEIAKALLLTASGPDEADRKTTQ